MKSNALLGSALAVACAVMAWSCEAVSPASPTALSSSRGPALRPFDEAPAPPPAPTPAPPAPVTTTVNIVGTDGSIAFNPNPVTAAIGDMLVWTNSDTRLHHIVLDDGRDIGDVMPGQASVAVAVATAAATGFHCTIHPTMVGAINGELPAPAPPPPPSYYPPPYEPDPYYLYY